MKHNQIKSLRPLAIVILSLALGACGNDVGGVASTHSPSSESRRLLSTPWKLINVEEDRLLVFLVSYGVCTPFDHMEVNEEGEHEILVTAFLREIASADCPGALGITYPTYELKRPLGSRKLVHAPVSPEEKVYEDFVKRAPTQQPSTPPS